jgi:APA family basic amino acid/polyamine antiporter
MTPIAVLGQLVSIGTLLAFVLVCIGIIILRRTAPELERPFRTPGVPYVPIAGAVICLAEMMGLPLATWMRLMAWLAIGLTIYFLYGRQHAQPNAHAPNAAPLPASPGPLLANPSSTNQ